MKRNIESTHPGTVRQSLAVIMIACEDAEKKSEYNLESLFSIDYTE